MGVMGVVPQKKGKRKMKVEKVILITCESENDEQEIMSFLDSYYLPEIWYPSNGWGFRVYVINKWDYYIEKSLYELKEKLK
jgi:hypothetical protein